MLVSLGNGVKKKFITNSSMDMGYQRENITWPLDPLVFVSEVDINDLNKEFEFSTKGTQKNYLNIKRFLIDRANHKLYKIHFSK